MKEAIKIGPSLDPKEEQEGEMFLTHAAMKYHITAENKNWLWLMSKSFLLTKQMKK